ncbi:MAG TPA: MFS transporter [Candidatus Binataceae bacterium]|nr:MFS transporter [Candidatus Binataceae bacterium]
MTFSERRVLHEYPRGAHRWTLLLLTVLATILASYEFQLSPLLPLILPDIHLSQIGYGYFITFSVAIAAVSAAFGGPLADRYGRVLIIDACLAAVTVLVFCNLLIHNVATFVVVRTLMSIVGGLMAGAGAALVRDMSPRLSRALAFGLFTIGPVGANFLANFIAGETLPIYHTWQSQIWITGFLAIAMYLPILFFLRDLSPQLRMQIFKSEIAAMEAQGHRAPAASELPSSTRDAFYRLLQHSEVWLLVIGVVSCLTLYFTIQPFGVLMFVQSFHYNPAEAASLNAFFWGGNIFVLILTGIVSDYLQMRKPIAIFGQTLAIALLIWWIPSFGHHMPNGEMKIVATLLGSFLAIGYVPWAAQFSETLEDVSPALQATGWAFFGFVARAWVAISAPMALTVASHSGWAKWVKVAIAGMIVYIVAMLLTRPHRSVHTVTVAQPQRRAMA